METRIIKQLTLAMIFLFIIGSLGFFSYQKYFSPENLCANNIQDKNEEGVDCGSFCNKPCLVIQDLEAVSKKLIKVGPLGPAQKAPTYRGPSGTLWDYDFLVEIKNPNFDQGALASYELSLFNNAQEIILSKKGSFYILPGQRKYIVESPLRTSQEAAGFEFIISQAQFREFKGFSEEALFSSQRQEYEVLGKPNEFSKLAGVISNNSNLSFDKADIVVVLYNEKEEVLAVARTDLRTILSKSERFFEVKWASPFEGQVSRIDIQAYTNLLDEGNIIKEEGGPQKF